MIKIALHDTLNIKIHSDDYKILNSLKKELSLYAKDYQFSPLYKLNRWDGKISLMKADNTIPYGLVNEVLRFFIKYYPNEKLTVEDEVKDLFHGTDLEPTFNLLFDPYYYQEKIVRTALKTSCGFFRVSVASGKSYCIANISKNLLDMGLINKQLIVVPTLSLIKQFYNDLIEYGIDESWLGVVNKDKKEFDNKIVISTWQSLKVRKEEYQQFQSIIVDECLVGETLILTDNGERKIKDIQVGDKVYSYNLNKKKFEIDDVVGVFENLQKSNDEKMYKLTFDNDKNIEITGNHKILTNDGYIRADEINEEHDIISL